MISGRGRRIRGAVPPRSRPQAWQTLLLSARLVALPAPPEQRTPESHENRRASRSWPDFLSAAAFARTRRRRGRAAGPRARSTALEQANEVRIVFSEPMVALGRIPEPVRGPVRAHRPRRWPGSFRWSGTTTLIFTPEPGALRYATRYQVTVDAAAASARGQALARPYSFEFTTPTVRLLQADWYRRGKRYDTARGPAAALQPAGLRGQPAAAPDLRARAPRLERARPAAGRRCAHALAPSIPRAAEAFAAKVAAASRRRRQPRRPSRCAPRARLGQEAVPALATTSWSWRRRTCRRPTPDLRVVVGAGARGVQGPETPKDGDREDDRAGADASSSTGFRCAAGLRPGRTTTRCASAAACRPAGAPCAPRASTSPIRPRPQPLARVEAAGRRDEDGEGDELAEEYGYDQTGGGDARGRGLQRAARAHLRRHGRRPDLTAADGQVLGYAWAGLVENWHRRTFAGFGGGHGVWEAGGGAIAAVPRPQPADGDAVAAAARASTELMPAAARAARRSPSTSAPGPAGRRCAGCACGPTSSSPSASTSRPRSPRAAGASPGRRSSEGAPIPRARQEAKPPVQASVVQVTNLALTVKDSPQNTLVLVTRLDDGEPVAGATVSIRTLDNAVFWTGATDADGIALAPRTALRDPEREWEFRFVVTAEKDGDVAYVGSDWNEGIAPWVFGLTRSTCGRRARCCAARSSPTAASTASARKCTSRPSCASDTPAGDRAAGRGHRRSRSCVKDTQGQEVDKRTVTARRLEQRGVDAEAAAEAPAGPLRSHGRGGRPPRSRLRRLPGRRLPPPGLPRGRRTSPGSPRVAGVGLKGVIAGPVPLRRRRWPAGRCAGPTRGSRSSTCRARSPTRFPPERYAMTRRGGPGAVPARAGDAAASARRSLGADGQLALDLETDRPRRPALPVPARGRGHRPLAAGHRRARASFRVDPAPWYVGLRRPPFFVGVDSGVETEVVAADLAGQPAAGVAVEVTLTQVQWHAVRRAEGGSFYTWETERREVPAGKWEITTAAAPTPLHVPLTAGGYFVLRAPGHRRGGPLHEVERVLLRPRARLHGLGAPRPQPHRPRAGEEALPPRRGGADPDQVAVGQRDRAPHHRARRRSARTACSACARRRRRSRVPITEDAIPNIYVSVVLVKGRTGSYAPEDSSDPGKPAFRVGYVQLEVDDASKRLAVDGQGGPRGIPARRAARTSSVVGARCAGAGRRRPRSRCGRSTTASSRSPAIARRTSCPRCTWPRRCRS